MEQLYIFVNAHGDGPSVPLPPQLADSTQLAVSVHLAGGIQLVTGPI